MLSESVATSGLAPRRHLQVSPEAGTGMTVCLLCRAGAHLYAVPLEHVVESMRVLAIDEVSGVPRYVRGLCIIRGAPVPVVDPGLLLGDEQTQPRRLVTIAPGHRTIALAVEDVLGVRALTAATFAALPPLLKGAAADTVAAVGSLDSELLFLLQVARIVPKDLLDRLAGDGAPA